MDRREKLRFISVCLSLPFFLTSGHLVFAVPMHSAAGLVTILCTILLQPIDHGNLWHLHPTSNRQLQSLVTFICTSLICIQLTNEVGNLLWQAVWLLTVMKTALPFPTKPAPFDHFFQLPPQMHDTPHLSVCYERLLPWKIIPNHLHVSELFTIR